VHVCVYLPEGEAHFDMELDGTYTLEELASEAADTLYSLIHQFYEELSNGDTRPTSVQ